MIGRPTYDANLQRLLAHDHPNDLDTVTYATTISLDVNNCTVHKTTTTSAVGNATINASGKGLPGQILYIIVVNDATSNRTITFGTNFKPSATLVGTTTKAATIGFVSDGTNWYELFRTTGL